MNVFVCIIKGRIFFLNMWKQCISRNELLFGVWSDSVFLYVISSSIIEFFYYPIYDIRKSGEFVPFFLVDSFKNIGDKQIVIFVSDYSLVFFLFCCSQDCISYELYTILQKSVSSRVSVLFISLKFSSNIWSTAILLLIRNVCSKG